MLCKQLDVVIGHIYAILKSSHSQIGHCGITMLHNRYKTILYHFFLAIENAIVELKQIVPGLRIEKPFEKGFCVKHWFPSKCSALTTSSLTVKQIINHISLLLLRRKGVSCHLSSTVLEPVIAPPSAKSGFSSHLLGYCRNSSVLERAETFERVFERSFFRMVSQVP